MFSLYTSHHNLSYILVMEMIVETEIIEPPLMETKIKMMLLRKMKIT